MPGVVIDLKVSETDIVKKDQEIIIIEAMKMENAIVAPVNARIISIAVTKESLIQKGDLLYQLPQKKEKRNHITPLGKI